MRNKIVIITIFVVVIGGFGALSKFSGTASDPKAVAYKSYKFTDRDRAELVVTKFIRAIETGNIKIATSLIEQDANYHSVNEIIVEYYSRHCQGKAKKHLILYPREFIFSDSILAMRFEIRNTIKSNENREAMLALVNKENQWLIETSSSFFEVLMLFIGNKKEKGDIR